MQDQATPLWGSEVVQTSSGLSRPSVSFAASTGPVLVVPQTEGEKDDNCDYFVYLPQVGDTTF